MRRNQENYPKTPKQGRSDNNVSRQQNNSDRQSYHDSNNNNNNSKRYRRDYKDDRKQYTNNSSQFKSNNLSTSNTNTLNTLSNSMVSENIKRFLDRLNSIILHSIQSSNQLSSFFHLNDKEQYDIWMKCWSIVSNNYKGVNIIILPKALLMLPDTEKALPSPVLVIKVLHKILENTQERLNNKSRVNMDILHNDIETVLNVIKNRLRGHMSCIHTYMIDISEFKGLIVQLKETLRLVLLDALKLAFEDRLMVLMSRCNPDIDDYVSELDKLPPISTSNTSGNTGDDGDNMDINIHGNTEVERIQHQQLFNEPWNGWHLQPTVGWLMSTSWHSDVPELRNNYRNSDEYSEAMLHIWTLLTFYWGSGAVWPKCNHSRNPHASHTRTGHTADKNSENTMCGSPLLHSAKYGQCSQRYKGQQCTGKATWKCFRHNHDMICDKCLIRHQNLLIGSPSHYSSTDIYDAIVDRETTRREGSVYIVSHLHSRKPPKIDPNWRTTYRLQPSCLIGVVKLGMSGEPLTRQHGIQWAEIVPVDMKTGRDLDWQKRQIGKLAFRLLSRADCQTISVDADTPLDINTPIAIIDLRVFVPEVVSVLATFSPMSFRQHLSQIPFVDCLIGRSHGFSIGSLALTADKRTLIREAINKSEIEVVRRMPQTSKDTIFTRIMELKQVDTLYGTQLHAFAMGLAASVHCTQGPPGTGKSYVGVVLVLAYMIIRGESTRLNYPVGPILMLSYKNHALDEFLCDVLEFAMPKLSPRQLIRGGKPENPKLLSYAERGSQEEVQAEKVLKERVDMIRRSQKISREWRDCATHFATKSMSINDMKLQVWKSTLANVSIQGFTDDIITLVQALVLYIKYKQYSTSTAQAYRYLSEVYQIPVPVDYRNVVDKLLSHLFLPVIHWVDPVFSREYSHEFWISKWIAGEMPPPRCQYCRKAPSSKNTSIRSDENKSADSSSAEDTLQCMNIADYHGLYCYSLHACRTQFGPCEKPRRSDHNVFCDHHRCLYRGRHQCTTERHPSAYYCSEHLCPICMQLCEFYKMTKDVHKRIEMKVNENACQQHLCNYSFRNTENSKVSCNQSVLLPWNYCVEHLCVLCVSDENITKNMEASPIYGPNHLYCRKHLCHIDDCDHSVYKQSQYCISHICLLCVDKDTSGNTAQSIDSICPSSKLCPIHRCRFDNNCPNRVVENSEYCIQHTCRVCIELKSTSLQMVSSDDSLPPRNVCIDHILCLYTYIQGGLCHEIAISDSPFCHYHHQRQVVEEQTNMDNSKTMEIDISSGKADTTKDDTLLQKMDIQDNEDKNEGNLKLEDDMKSNCEDIDEDSDKSYDTYSEKSSLTSTASPPLKKIPTDTITSDKSNIIPPNAVCSALNSIGKPCKNKTGFSYAVDDKIYCNVHVIKVNVAKPSTDIDKKSSNSLSLPTTSTTTPTTNTKVSDQHKDINEKKRKRVKNDKKLNLLSTDDMLIEEVADLKDKLKEAHTKKEERKEDYSQEDEIRHTQTLQFTLQHIQNIQNSINSNKQFLRNTYQTLLQNESNSECEKDSFLSKIFSKCNYMDPITKKRCTMNYLELQGTKQENICIQLNSNECYCVVHRTSQRAIEITKKNVIKMEQMTTSSNEENMKIDTAVSTSSSQVGVNSNKMSTNIDMKINPNTSYSTPVSVPPTITSSNSSNNKNNRSTNISIEEVLYEEEDNNLLPDLPDMEIKECLGGRELDPDEMDLETEVIEYEEVEENEEQRRLKEIDGDDIEHGDVEEVYSDDDDDDDDVDGTESRQTLPSRNLTIMKASVNNSKTSVSSTTGTHSKNDGEKVQVEDEKVALELLKSWSWDMPVQARLSSAAYFLRCMSTIVNKLRMDSDEHVNSARKDRAQAGARAFRQALIVGSTVVGAARRLEAIRAAEPFAVVVEESCEVMEPTLMAVLAVKSLQKLELIGDHRQLPAFVQQCWYNLELTHPSIKTSLFERLVEGGSHRLVKRSRRNHDDDQDDSIPPLSCTVLDEQRRMRTCISDLTRCEYEDITDIQDHEHTAKQCIGDTWLRHQNKKAKGYEEFIHHRQLWDTKGREIPGVLPSVFFWNLKDNKESRPIAGLSACNETEAKAVAHLTRYLITCGVPAASITIITPYKGQKTQITKELRALKVLPPYNPNINAMSDTVMVSTVDRYQGDENDIVILSLVRIRPGNRFVGLLNRFIVACSRARLGFYIVGTVDAVIKDTQGTEGPSHWRRLIDDLTNNTKLPSKRGSSTSSNVSNSSNASTWSYAYDEFRTAKDDNTYHLPRMSPSIPICCPRHRHYTQNIYEDPTKLPTQFNWNEFCSLQCTYQLPICGHTCAKLCHSPTHIPHTESCALNIPSPCIIHYMNTVVCGVVSKGYKTLQDGLDKYQCDERVIYNRPECKHHVPVTCYNKQLLEKGDAKLPECIEIVSDYIHPMCNHIIKTPKCHVRRTYEMTPPKCMVDVIMERICGCKVRMKCYEKIKELQQSQNTPVQCYEDVNLPRPRCSHMISLRCHLATVLKKQYQNTYDICRTYGPEANTLLVRYKGTYTEEESMYFKKEIPTCYVPVNMEYPCGHIIKNIPCHEAFQYVKRGQLVRNCEAIVQTVHPICKHPISIPCYMKQKLEEIDMWTAVGEPDSDDKGLVVLESKAKAVTLPYSKDILQTLLTSCKANTKLIRMCDDSHIYNLACSTFVDMLMGRRQLNPCDYKVQRKLPCNHTAEVLCSDRFKEPPPRCNIPVNYMYCYPCGQHKIQPGICHKYYTLLSQDNLCPFMIDYQLKRCKHTVQIKCHTKSSIKEYIGEELQVLGDQVIVEANKLYGKPALGAPECTSLVAYMNDCGHLRQGVECHTAFDWAAGQLKAPNCERSIEHDSPLCGHLVNMKCCVWKKIDTWSAWTNDEHPYFEDIMDTMVSVGTRSDIITVRMYHEDVLDSPKVLPVGVSWKEIECKVPVQVQRNCHHILTMNCTDLFQCMNRLPPCIETVTHACEDCSVERVWQCQDYTKFIRNGGYNGTNQLSYPCMNPVNKVCTVCGINRVTVSCSQKEPQCHQPVSYTLVSCGHEIQWHCGADNDPRIETYPCRTCVLSRWNEHIETQDTMMKELITQPDQLQVINEEFNMNCVYMITDKIKGTYDIMKIHPIQNIKFSSFFDARMKILKNYRTALINKKVDILELPPSYFNTIDDLQNYHIIYTILDKPLIGADDKIDQMYRTQLLKYGITNYGNGYYYKRMINMKVLETIKSEDSIVRLICGIAYGYQKRVNLPVFGANVKKEGEKISKSRKYHIDRGIDHIEIHDDDKHIYEGVYWEPSQVLPLCYIELKVHTKCCICQDDYLYNQGFFCSNRHFLCWETCFDGYIESARQPDAMTRCLDEQGNLRCPECQESYHLLTVAQTPGAPKETFDKLLKLSYVGKKEATNELKQALEDNTTRLKAEYDRIMAMKNEEERKAHLLRLEIIENILILRCPQCKVAFMDYDACAAITCTCGIHICACCLQGSREDNHAHVINCPQNPYRNVWISKEQFHAIHRTRRQQAVQHRLEREPKDVQRVTYKLLERDLADLGIQIPRL